jgi:hypothetical protein
VQRTAVRFGLQDLAATADDYARSRRRARNCTENAPKNGAVEAARTANPLGRSMQPRMHPALVFCAVPASGREAGRHADRSLSLRGRLRAPRDARYDHAAGPAVEVADRNELPWEVSSVRGDPPTSLAGHLPRGARVALSVLLRMGNRTLKAMPDDKSALGCGSASSTQDPSHRNGTLLANPEEIGGRSDYGPPRRCR